MKSKNEKEFNQKCSFKPKINIDLSSTPSSSSLSYSKKLTTSTIASNNNTNSNSNNRLSTEQAKEQMNLKEIQKYNSKKLPMEVIEANSERLYGETKVIKKNKAELTERVFNEIYPFKPTVNDTSTPTVHNFFVRLQNWVDQKNTKIHEQNNSLPIDYNTKQVLFTPIISDYPISRTQEIYEYLHNEKRLKELKQQEIKENVIKEIITQSSKPKISVKSQKIVDKQKEKVFNALFEYLDIDNSSIIKYSDSIKQKLSLCFSTAFIKEFDSLLIELKELNETLNRTEFVTAMDKLYNGMPLAAKREIMAFNPK